MLKDFWLAQVAGAKALSALAGYCVSNDAARVEVANLLPAAEFHFFIESATILNITSLLQDRDLDVRTAGADALSKIAEHCTSQ